MKRMKKVLLATLTASTLALSLCACGGSTNAPKSSEATETTEYLADNDFMSDLAKSLEQRWTNTADEKVDGLSDDEYAKHLTSIIQGELDMLSKYQSEKFEDSLLHENVIAYINNLKDQLDVVKFYTADFNEYVNRWEDVYNKRMILIKKFVDEFGLKVSDEYQSIIDDMTTSAQLIEEKENKEKVINDWLKNLEFKETKNEYDWKTYSCVAENKTGVDFEYIGLEINLIDKDGVIIESTYAGADNVKDGSKFKLEFSTDVDFKSYEIEVDYY